MQKSKLRIGLLLNGTELLAWQYRMIEIIKDSDYAEISLVVQKTLTDEKQLLLWQPGWLITLERGRFGPP